MTTETQRNGITFLCSCCTWYAAKYSKHGQCRKHSPTDDGKWPTVSNTDWCGDHKPNADMPLINIETSTPSSGSSVSRPQFLVDLDNWNATATLKGSDGFI